MLVFVHINKTAGRTVRYILRSSYGRRHCEVEPWHASWDGAPFSTSDFTSSPQDLSGSCENCRPSSYRLRRSHEEGTDFRLFAFLRDPLRLCASRFQYHVEQRKKKDVVFDECPTRMAAQRPDKTDRRQAERRRCHPDYREKEMFVGLTERFDESMLLLKALRVDDLDNGYTPVNVARENTLAKELLSKRDTRQAIIDSNEADIALYDYVRNELYPRFQREYGSELEDAVAEYVNSPQRRFNRKNPTASRVKQYTLYKPLLRPHRDRMTSKIGDKLLNDLQRP